MNQNKKPQLHISGIDTLGRCGEQFRRRYIDNEKRPPGIAAIVGTSTHRSVEKNLKSKMEKGSLLSIEEVRDTARDALEKNWVSGVMLNEEEVQKGLKKCKAEAIDKAVRLSALHAEKKAPEINPTHLERKWCIEMKNYPMDLVGQLDIQEGISRLRDVKTSGKTPDKSVADNSLQLTAYSLAIKIIDGEAPKEVQLDYLIDTKEPNAVSFTSTRDNNDFQMLLRRIEAAIICIQKGAFIPSNTDQWICNPKWCGYYSDCKYVKQPKQISV